jgi:hypothetical protein
MKMAMSRRGGGWGGAGRVEHNAHNRRDPDVQQEPRLRSW